MCNHHHNPRDWSTCDLPPGPLGPEPVLLTSAGHGPSGPFAAVVNPLTNEPGFSVPSWTCQHHCCPVAGLGSVPADGGGSVGPGFLSPCCTLPRPPPTRAGAPATLMWFLFPVLHLACTWGAGHQSRPAPPTPCPLCCFSEAVHDPSIFQILPAHLGLCIWRGWGIRAWRQLLGRYRKPWHLPAFGGEELRLQ